MNDEITTANCGKSLFDIGQRVYSPAYGEGTVVKLRHDALTEILWAIVEFDSTEVATFQASTGYFLPDEQDPTGQVDLIAGWAPQAAQEPRKALSAETIIMVGALAFICGYVVSAIRAVGTIALWQTF